MRIKNITVENFKSFERESIDFNTFEVLIGANASGKSNTISLFRFINNILVCGIDDAISLLGGIDYIVNASIGKFKPIKISFKLELSDKSWVRVIDKKSGLTIDELFYECEILPNKRGPRYKIVKDNLYITYRYVKYSEVKSNNTDKNKIDELYSVEFIKKRKAVSRITALTPTSLPESEVKTALGIEFLEKIINEDKDELILNKLDFFLPPILSNGLVKIYDFDPKLIKKPSVLTSAKSLDEDGANLANVLQGILKESSNKRKLTNILNDCLPFIQNISFENNIDRSIIYKIKEKYNSKSFHSTFLSDGTVNILALITALYFDKTSNIVIIEEPERNIHPRLMSRIINMAKEVSENKQVIITTHNPELVKHTELESILFAKRCEKGFTSIIKPSNSEILKNFLSSELGIEDLFIQDMIGI